MEVIKGVNLSFHLWNSILSLMLILSLYVSKRIQKRSEKLYLAMLFCNMCGMLMDVVSVIFSGKLGGIAWFGEHASNFLEFSFNNLLALLFMYYIEAYIQECMHVHIKKKFLKIGTVLLGISEVLLILNLFYPCFYVVDEQNVYSRLPLFPLIYLEVFFVLFVAALQLCYYWKQFRTRAILSFVIYIIFPILAVIATSFIYGITLGYVGTTTALIVVFLFLQFEQRQKEIEQDASNEMEQMKEYENLVNEGMKISIQKESPDASLQAILQYLGEMLHGDRAYIFEKNEREENDNTYEWCAEGIEPQIDILQNVPPEYCATWYDAFKRKQVVIIKDIEEIRETEPLVYEILKPQNVTSLVSFPIIDQHKAIGFLGIDNPPEDVIRMTQAILEITSSFITTEIKRRDLIRRLEHMSYTDVSTGAGNRFAVHKYFESIKEQGSLGVVFCDITGLKEVNDTRGHAAGDELIRNTYLSLTEGFSSSEIFRMGGDEFVVLAASVTEEELEKRIAIVRSKLADQGIVAAIGAEWREHAKETLELTIRQAELCMYEEKRQWYTQKGNDRRNFQRNQQNQEKEFEKNKN